MMDTFFSYAKINIGLYIKGRRSDGLHLLRSMFQEVTLADKIAMEFVSSSDSISLEINDKSIPTDERNTIYQAVSLLQPFFQMGVNIYVEKNIPHEAGLGGGSSNAAQTLLALNRLATLNLTEQKLQKLAFKIGCDVPFFLRGNQADVQGLGEIVTPIFVDMPYHLVIVKPQNVSFSTKDIYHNFQPYLKERNDTNDLEAFYNSPSLKKLKKLKNDLERVVFHHPMLQKVRVCLEKAGAYYVSMSGSGSAMYGVFPSKSIPNIEIGSCDIFHVKPRMKRNKPS